MAQSGPRMTQNDPKWPKNDPKWPTITPKWPKNDARIYAQRLAHKTLLIKNPNLKYHQQQQQQ